MHAFRAASHLPHVPWVDWGPGPNPRNEEDAILDAVGELGLARSVNLARREARTGHRIDQRAW